MRLFFTLLFLIQFCSAYSQTETVITIAGAIVNENTQPITQVTIKVTKINNASILGYINSGNSNKFSINSIYVKADTILVTASCMGYKTKVDTLVLAANKSNYYIEFNLSVVGKTLDEVIINAPPIWKRGDTTFYKVDAFKEGEEKKLIDIIIKMPGFRIDANGVLTYKNSPVEKLMIEGEEIFADKIQLLLKSIPVHVLSTIQALENQTSNKLLKGLGNDSKVFVNIGLKKDRLKTAFGDGEVGVGTLNRYKINPVLFSIYGKIKGGYIGNFNNNGQSLTTWEDYKLKSKGMLLSEYDGSAQTNFMQRIPHFADSRYIKNNLIDNRLQLNFPISKKIKNELEVTFIKDNQSQNSLLQNTLFDNSTYFNQRTELGAKYRPIIFKLQNKSIWSINKSSEITWVFNYDVNNTETESNSFIEQNNVQYNTNATIQNRWNAFSASFDLVKRKNEFKANHLTGEYSYNDLSQSIFGTSSNWYSLFSLPDTRYTLLEHNFKNYLQTAKLVYEEISKKRKLPLSWQFNAEWQQAILSAPLVFKVDNNLIPDYNKTDFLGNGKYQIGKMYNSSFTSIKLFGKQTDVKLDFGVSNVKIEEPNINYRKEIFQALYNIELNQKRKLSEKILSLIDLQYSQSPQKLYQTATAIYPSAVAQFRTRKNSTFPTREFSADYKLFFLLKKYTRYNLLFNYTTNFINHIYTPLYKGFVLVSTDSMIKKVANSFVINSEVSFPWLFLKAKITIGGSFSINQSFINYKNELLTANIIRENLNLEVKRNWNKKIFLKFNSNLQANTNKFPKEIKNESVLKSIDFINTLALRFHIGHNTDIKLSGEYLQNNLYTDNEYIGFFSDLETSYTIPKKKLTLSIKLENITNQEKYFSLSTYSALSQSFFSIPLIKRNIFASIRYEL